MIVVARLLNHLPRVGREVGKRLNATGWPARRCAHRDLRVPPPIEGRVHVSTPHALLVSLGGAACSLDLLPEPQVAATFNGAAGGAAGWAGASLAVEMPTWTALTTR